MGKWSRTVVAYRVAIFWWRNYVPFIPFEKTTVLPFGRTHRTLNTHICVTLVKHNKPISVYITSDSTYTEHKSFYNYDIPFLIFKNRASYI